MDKIQHIDKEQFHGTFREMCPDYQYIPAVHSDKKIHKLYVFGDLHGDLKLFKKMLRLANVVDNQYNWTGGNAWVVQVGDQIDRCRPLWNKDCSFDITINDEASDIDIMELANKIMNQAIKVGGMVISLLGNHELMNVNGNMNYVSRMGIIDFSRTKEDTDENYEEGKLKRIEDFRPGNKYGTMLGCTRLPAVIIGTHLFVHAGIVDALIEEIQLNNISDIENINIAIRMWLLGKLNKESVQEIITGSKSMFWTRILGSIPPNVPFSDAKCVNEIGKVLKLFKVDNIIIGHTPQSFLYSESLNHTCSGHVWRVDNGSSKAFDRYDEEFMSTQRVSKSRRVQILEIEDDIKYYIIDDIGRREIQV